MLRRRLASAALVAGLLVAGCALAGASEPRALLELFTSQGCSSCPPADKLLGELADDPSLVAISLPIDYWDYLGWKDTLAIPGHSARQRAYARVRGDRQVYTPQIVVNGSTHVLGSDHAAIERAIAQTDRNAAIMSAARAGVDRRQQFERQGRCRQGSSRRRSLALPAARNRFRSRSAAAKISGHTVTYHNVVRRWLKLGDWTGNEATWNVPISDFMTDQVDAAAVMVQQGSHEKPGMILGAAFVPLGARTTEVRQPASGDQFRRTNGVVLAPACSNNVVANKKAGEQPAITQLGIEPLRENSGPVRPHPGGLGG